MEQNMIGVFTTVITKLESESIPYMVVGSVASMVYGEPRMTHDMDLVIDILPEDASKLQNLFPIKEFYCPPIEVLNSEIIERGQFNLIHQTTGIKIDLMIRKNSDHGKTEFDRRQKVPFWQGSEVFIATPEDVIIKKLSFYREGQSEKHLRDIRGILTETTIDKEYLNYWIQKLSLSSEWDKV